jgi:hypothetical protein
VLGPEKCTDTYEVSAAQVWFIHLTSPVAVQQSAGTNEAQLNHDNVTRSIGPHVQTELDVPRIPCIIAYLGCLNVLAQFVVRKSFHTTRPRLESNDVPREGFELSLKDTPVPEQLLYISCWLVFMDSATNNCRLLLHQRKYVPEIITSGRW